MRQKFGTNQSGSLAPLGVSARIAPELGLAIKELSFVGARFIDDSYRGEIGVIRFNHSPEHFHVQVGDKIGVNIFKKIKPPIIQKVKALTGTQRGSGGFRSMEL